MDAAMFVPGLGLFQSHPPIIQNESEMPTLEASKSRKITDFVSIDQQSNRRKGVPKKADTRAKFEKRMELSEALMSGVLRNSVQNPKENRKRNSEAKVVSTSEKRSKGFLNGYQRPKEISESEEARRRKELDKAKEKAVYVTYLERVSREERVDGVHPMTPNRKQICSRRNWDSQVRRWKKALYQAVDMSPSESANTSFCSSSTDCSDIEEEICSNKPIFADLNNISIPVRSETDDVASLMGHVGLDGDESTLKGSNYNSSGAGKPVDFSVLS